MNGTNEKSTTRRHGRHAGQLESYHGKGRRSFPGIFGVCLSTLLACTLAGGVAFRAQAEDSWLDRVLRDIRQEVLDEEKEDDKPEAADQPSTPDEPDAQTPVNEPDAPGLTLRGRIMDIERISAGTADQLAAQLRVEGEQEQRILHLGRPPAEAMNLRTGDQVQILGQYDRQAGWRYFNAREIQPRFERLNALRYGDERILQGRITTMRRLAMESGSLAAVELGVRTVDGWDEQVVLGDASAFEAGQTLRIGSRIRADGFIQQHQGREIVALTRPADDTPATDVYGVERADQDRQREVVRLNGRIEHIQSLRVEDGHIMAQLRFEDGRTQLVDFGSPENFDNIQIRTSDRIGLQGRMAQHHGEQVLAVQRINIDGHWHRLGAPREHRLEPSQD